MKGVKGIANCICMQRVVGDRASGGSAMWCTAKLPLTFLKVLEECVLFWLPFCRSKAILPQNSYAVPLALFANIPVRYESQRR